MPTDSQRGQELQRMARDLWVAMGARVEVAQKQILWIPDKAGAVRFTRRGAKPSLRPISKHHDFFNVWDLMYVLPGVRAFVQVTTWQGVPERRQKILASGFPATPHDYIMGHLSGLSGAKRQEWRVVRWPAFATDVSERWTLTSGRVEREPYSL